ncbi:MAG: protein kinase [Lachnospiraceae bacterium]|nr:protein kinase [Lachnospiraceae bacterium]
MISPEVFAIITGGRYRIVSSLGSGGMSEVLLAEDIRLHVRRAIKKIKTGDGSKSYIAGSVISEANVLRKVVHPALPRIVDIFREDGCVNLVMEYIEGRTLEQVLSERTLSEKQIILTGLEICSALSCLHSMKPPVIYRDMKPSNIMVRPDGHICLIDFGTAKRVYTGKKDTTLLGTYGYAAPEQFRGRTDERSDIYSLGMTLKACVNGADNKAHRNRISKDLKKIIEKCTQEKSANRYRNTAELRSDLLRLRHRGIRLLLLSCAAIMVLLTVGGIAYGINTGHTMAQSLNKSVSGADAYMRCVQSGNEAYFIGDYARAEQEYTRAIVDTDPSRDTAYLQLLKLYRKLNLSREGLDRIDTLLKDNEFLIETHEINYECALTAFYDLGDYARAGEYLSRIDFDVINEAQYLYELSGIMNSFNIDIAGIYGCLERFRTFNASLPAGEKRLKNDINIATLLLTYSDELDSYTRTEDSLFAAEELMKEALNLSMTGTFNEDEEYLLKELGMLSTIYRMLGSRYGNKKEEYYSHAIDYTRQFLREESAYENEGEVRLKLFYMAKMYEELNDYDNALKCYENSEELYPFEGSDIYTGHLRCLIKSRAGREEVISLYREALKVEGISKSPEFLRLEKVIKEDKL